MTTAPDLLGALRDELADRIAARIGAVATGETYDSRHLPARCSRRRFAEVCRARSRGRRPPDGDLVSAKLPAARTCRRARTPPACS
jgi:hypothetical protein